MNDVRSGRVHPDELNCYHVRQELVEHNMETGERVSSPMLQKYSQKNFLPVVEALRDSHYKVDVLFDPTVKEVPAKHEPVGVVIEPTAEAEVEPAKRVYTKRNK